MTAGAVAVVVAALAARGAPAGWRGGLAVPPSVLAAEVAATRDAVVIEAWGTLDAWAIVMVGLDVAAAWGERG